MRYLFGDSTESNLDFNYLAFLREVIDCAVVLVECDVTLANVAERQRTRERETEAALAAVAAFGQRAKDFVAPIAEDQAGTAVGRCAAAIAAAIRDAVEAEASEAKARLGAERDELSREGQAVNKRAREAFEKLLRTHDLPGSGNEVEVQWNASGGVKATMRQRTEFGVEAVLALDMPAGSILYTPDLRVDRVAEGVEVHAREAGGWLKKGEKLVPHRLGRYHVVGITIATNVRIQLRGDGTQGEILLISQPNGDITAAATGGATQREIVIEDRDRGGLRSFIDKLEAATRTLADARGSVVAIEIDGKSMTDQRNPRAVAERLTSAIGPTVQKIKQHSRSPGELVLRRLLGDNRREEIYVSIDELVEKIEVLPVHARGVFAPLNLKEDGSWKSAPAPVARHVDTKQPDTKPMDKPIELKPSEAKWDARGGGAARVIEPKADPRVAPDRPSDGRPEEIARPQRITGAGVPMPMRTKEPTQPGAAPAEIKRPQSVSGSPVPAVVPPLATTPMSSSPSIPSALASNTPTIPAAKAVDPDDDDEDDWPSIAKSEPSDGNDSPLSTKS